jgi:carboxylesterase type B
VFAGASNYFDGTAYAALHNVVFVSVNYRVGIFGIVTELSLQRISSVA